jgi:hypothetical protein
MTEQAPPTVHHTPDGPHGLTAGERDPATPAPHTSSSKTRRTGSRPIVITLVVAALFVAMAVGMEARRHGELDQRSQDAPTAGVRGA